MSAVVSTVAELLTSTIIRAVGSVVAMFCGCGGRIMTGSMPVGSKNIQQLHISLKLHLLNICSDDYLISSNNAVFFMSEVSIHKIGSGDEKDKTSKNSLYCHADTISTKLSG
jgi:hypothetical protein